MPRWPPTDAELLAAIEALDALGMPYAELWRRLRPVTRRIGCRHPTYWLVRRRAIESRRRKLEHARVVADVYRDLARGVVPARWR